MADFHTRELDDVVHRLLPSEIFADIGIVDAATTSDARSSHAVVEELAAHLVGVLGLAGMKPQPQSRVSAYHLQDLRMARHAPGFGRNNTVFDSGVRQRVRRFVPTAPCASANTPPARLQRSTGTGVFFPRAVVYQTRASKSPKNVRNRIRFPSASSLNKLTAGEEGGGQCHAMMMKQRQQHAMAAAMEQYAESNCLLHFMAALSSSRCHSHRNGRTDTSPIKYVTDGAKDACNLL